MGTWIVLLHFLLPSFTPVVASEAPKAAPEIRYHGVEALFAKFDREADGEIVLLD